MSQQASVAILDPGSDSATGRAGSPSAADRFMLRLLRISTTDAGALSGAHRAFRLSLLVTAIRCTVIYLVVPILIPILSIAGVVAKPLSIALCLFALVNGVVSVRRFWLADHRAKWKYTAFMAVVFVVLIVSIVIDVVGLVAA